MKQRTPWQNIFTVNSLNPILRAIIRLPLSFVFCFFAVTGCASRGGMADHERPKDVLPQGPGQLSSYDTFLQGVNYLRDHPTPKEDERVQRFLWEDRWIRVLQEKQLVTPEMSRDFWNDLTGFVHDEPPLSLGALDRLASSAQTSLGRNTVLYQRYQMALRSQSIEEALKSLEQIQADGTTDLYSRAQEILQLNRNRSAGSSRKIGVLLPLSGNLKAFGEDALQSIQMASQLAANEGVEFLIEDTGETKESLIQAFEKLAVRSKVTAILGPLTAGDSEVVFERAQLLQIPVISLAAKEGLENYGPFAFRSTLTLEDQVKKVAQFIERDLQAKKVAILMPDSPYGWDVIDRAKTEFEEHGLQISQLEVHPASATDFNGPLRRMTRLDVPALRKDEFCPRKGEGFPGCAKKSQDLKPLIDFEVLFVPNSADKVGLMLPTLPYLRMYGVQVVGLSGYNSAQLLERGGEASEGVIFTDGYLPSSQDFPTVFFRNLFLKTAKREPSRLAAEAFDLAMIVSEIMKRSPIMDRNTFIERLKAVNNYPGVTGNISYDSQKLKKQPRLIVVRDGAFKELELQARR